MGAQSVIGWPAAQRAPEQNAWKRDIAHMEEAVDLTDAMRKRFQADLQHMLDEGKAAINMSGWIIPMHNHLTAHELDVVAQENKSRKLLYRLLAEKFNQPETHIQEAFTEMWLGWAGERQWLIQDYLGRIKTISKSAG